MSKILNRKSTVQNLATLGGAVFAFSIASSFPAQAQGNGKSEQPMSGVYVAIDGGLADYKITGFAETFPPKYAARKRTPLNIDGRSAFVRGNLGYGYHLDNNIFVGAELGYAKLTSGTNILIPNKAINHEVGVSYSSRIDISGLLGYDISEKNMVFARLGYGRANINVSPRDVGGKGGSFNNLKGLIYGLGYARHFNDNIDFRVEIVNSAIKRGYDNTKNDSEIYKVKLRDTRISAGLVFSF